MRKIEPFHIYLFAYHACVMSILVKMYMTVWWIERNPLHFGLLGFNALCWSQLEHVDLRKAYVHQYV